MQNIIIHCQTSLQPSLFKLGLDYEYNCGEYDVIVDNIPNLNDEELCTHYGIDYNQIIRIEALNFCAI